MNRHGMFNQQRSSMWIEASVGGNFHGERDESHMPGGTFVGEVYPAHLKGSEARTGRHHNGLIRGGSWDFSRHFERLEMYLWVQMYSRVICSIATENDHVLSIIVLIIYKWAIYTCIFAIGQKKTEDLSILPTTWPRASSWRFSVAVLCPAGGTRSEREETFSGWADLG